MWSRVTQYRYHASAFTPGSVEERLGVTGADHQLKMVILPEQIEYLAQKIAKSFGYSPEEAVESTAALLLRRADGQENRDTA